MTARRARPLPPSSPASPSSPWPRGNRAPWRSTTPRTRRTSRVRRWRAGDHTVPLDRPRAGARSSSTCRRGAYRPLPARPRPARRGRDRAGLRQRHRLQPPRRPRALPRRLPVGRRAPCVLEHQRPGPRRAPTTSRSSSARSTRSRRPSASIAAASSSPACRTAAGMTARLGCELSERLAGAAAVAGGYRSLPPCRPQRPLPVLEIHGTADQVVPYGGKAPDYRGSVARWLAQWRRIDGCRGKADRLRPAPGVTEIAWRACSAADASSSTCGSTARRTAGPAARGRTRHRHRSRRRGGRGSSSARCPRDRPRRERVERPGRGWPAARLTSTPCARTQRDDRQAAGALVAAGRAQRVAEQRVADPAGATAAASARGRDELVARARRRGSGPGRPSRAISGAALAGALTASSSAAPGVRGAQEAPTAPRPGRRASRPVRPESCGPACDRRHRRRERDGEDGGERHGDARTRGARRGPRAPTPAPRHRRDRRVDAGSR